MVEENLGRSSIRILVADDNAVNVKLAVRMVNKLGFDVDAVFNGQEAIGALRLKHYDLILMDLQMPEIDGITATYWLFANQAELVNLPPIIAMTANTSLADQQLCLDAGMVDFVPKPFSIATLEKVLRRWTSVKTQKSVV